MTVHCLLQNMAFSSLADISLGELDWQCFLEGSMGKLSSGRRRNRRVIQFTLIGDGWERWHKLVGGHCDELNLFFFLWLLISSMIFKMLSNFMLKYEKYSTCSFYQIFVNNRISAHVYRNHWNFWNYRNVKRCTLAPVSLLELLINF